MPLDAAQLQQIFDQSGVPAWSEETAEDATNLLQKVLRELGLIEAEYTRRFKLPPSPPIAEQIGADWARVRALIQALASPMTTTMRTMVYCLLDGASVTALRFEYRALESAHLEVTVEYSHGKSSQFVSDEFWDAEVLRHFGLFKQDDKPVLDGYYPL